VGRPVTDVPGERPRSPIIVVTPELVTVDEAMTPKVAVDPRKTRAGAGTITLGAEDTEGDADEGAAEGITVGSVEGSVEGCAEGCALGGAAAT
jgi:hypothetical protein